MTEHKQFKPNPTQLELFALASDPRVRNLLLYGGSRGGKSAGIAALVFTRALKYPGTRHAIFRLTLRSCHSLLGPSLGTYPEIIEMIYPGYLSRPDVDVAKSDGRITMHNGSQIIFEGLDPTRIDKVLGAQYATVHVNECNEIADYDIIQQLASRMADSAQLQLNGKLVFDSNNDPVMLRPLMIFDCNPRFKRDWEYQAFINKVSPTSGLPHRKPETWAALKIQPADNSANQAEGYLEMLTDQYHGSAKMMARFVEGEWSDDNPNALFRSDLIRYQPVDRNDLIRILVAVDPAVTANKNSDETGIVVVGLDANGLGYVLEDRSLKGPPEMWAKAAVDAYNDWDADCIVAEKNQGGLMVETTIKQAKRNVPVKLVHASRGKVARAEPVSMLYVKGKVVHAEAFKQLEGQMFDFGLPNNPKSPDRVDALVWGMSELFKLGTASGTVVPQRAGGLWR